MSFATWAADGRLDREVEERIAKAAVDALLRVAWKRPEISLTKGGAVSDMCVVIAVVWG